MQRAIFLLGLASSARGLAPGLSAARRSVVSSRMAAPAMAAAAPAEMVEETAGKTTGPVCIVTGGSRGLGRAIALALGAEGCKVVVNYANSAGAAESVVEEIKALGGDGVAIQADMGTTEGINGLFKETAAAFDEPVGVLVNNAGIT